MKEFEQIPEGILESNLQFFNPIHLLEIQKFHRRSTSVLDQNQC